MRAVIPDKVSQRIVNLVLMDTARSLTGHDLLKITEMAEQAHAVVHVSYGSWQVLVGVPECSYDLIAADLQAMGMNAVSSLEKLMKFLPLFLVEWCHEASL